MKHTGKMKNLIAILVFLSAFCLIYTACAASSGTCGAEGDGSNLTWTLDDEGLLTISGTGAMKDFSGGFSPWGGSIRKVIINDGITSIGNNAFRSSANLTSVTLGNDIDRIGWSAFSHCTSLPSIVIPESVTSIDGYVFDSCINLKSATVNAQLINTNNNIYYLEFHNNFMNCKNLEEIIIPNNHSFYSSQDGIVFSKNKDALVYCPEGKTGTYIVPLSVTSIEWFAFYNCKKLKSVKLSENITRIRTDAFQYSNILLIVPENSYAHHWANWHWSSRYETFKPSVIVAGGKYEIDTKKKAAFFIGPTDMNTKTLIIQDAVKYYNNNYIVTEIAEGACKNMTKMTTLTIGKNVKSIGKEAFLKCKKTKKITFLGTELKKVGENAFSGISKKVVVFCQKTKIKAYTKLLQKAGAPKSARFQELN